MEAQPLSSGSSRQAEENDVVALKRPYERPQIVYRQPLEVMASICAPAPPAKANPGLCPQGPISS